MPYLGAVPMTTTAVDVVDGSIIDADIHSAAAIASSKIAHGTTANKVLPLNGSAQIPAVNGELLLNVGRLIESTQTPANNGQVDFTVSYEVGKILVFLNGVKLLPTTDFTATNGTTVSLTLGANTTDKIEFCVFDG